MAYLTILSIQICYENVKMLLVFVMLFDGPILGWPSPDLLCSLGNRQAVDKQTSRKKASAPVVVCHHYVLSEDIFIIIL